MSSSADIRFVLFEPTHPGNIGSVARAIKTMGFQQLYLVNPPPEHICTDSRAMASGAQDVLHGAKVVTSLPEALEGCGLVLGASARHRRIGCPEMDPRECARQAMEQAASKPVALVFGPERSGLANEELDLCSAIVYIPANPDYSSLNLSQAVQIIAYELRQQQILERELPPRESPLAGPAAMELFYEHFERVLLASGFLNPQNPRHLMRRLRRLFNRAQVDENELNILRGILSAVAPGSGPRPKP
ncbi:MAG: RNA methyltransferase [Gammaproteobacteria bacterium]|nr:RNA methyltransferase [Gammaproteobacteria bacterium]MCP5139156.1 RNA methyltransferase [Chromatiales bacterium]